MKIILSNVYPMDLAYKQWEQGIYPGHHLWGIIGLQKKNDMEVTILKHEKYKLLNRLGDLLHIEFLEQQIRAVWLLRKKDVLYAPYAAANTKFILLLKLLRLLHKPVVIVVHQPLLGYRTTSPIKKYLIRKLVSQYDSIIFLSKVLKDDLINTLAIAPEEAAQKFHHVNWGPEIDFYKDYSTPKDPRDTHYAISAGHTSRDFDTIIEAFRSIDFKLKIFCTPKSVPTTKHIPDNIEIIADATPISYLELLKEYDSARMILIPLTANPGGTEGLTSLLDVFAMGKPVIMTKNPKLDLDIDKEGLGLTVNYGDVEGWIKAVNSIKNDFELLKRMGDNSLELFHTTYNLDLFSQELERIMRKTHQVYSARHLKESVLAEEAV